MTLAEAIGLRSDDVVALVGGGGKTSAMFLLAREAVARGGYAITTTTTRIFGAQIALAPAHILAADATEARVKDALDRHGQVLVIGATEAGSGKAEGVSLELVKRLRAWCPDACLINEADGSRMRPFKAPAAYEPVIPESTTVVVPVVGADVLGAPLDAEHVHRPELISALCGAPIGTAITPAIVAQVIAHAQGGRKGVPEGARVAVVINKVETLADRGPARETAERLLRAPGIDRVVLASLRAEPPVLEVLSR